MDSLSLRQREVFETLRNFIQENGYPPTLRELARKLGIINPTAIKRMLGIFEEKGLLEIASGKSRAIKLKIISEKNAYGSVSEIFPDEIIPLPIAGRIVAGATEEAIETIEGKIPVPSFLARNNAKAFLLKVKGDSMEPELHEGDLVVIHPQNTPQHNDIVAAMVEGEATIKQFLKARTGYLLHPLNTAYKDIPMNKNFRIIGKVTGLMREF